MDRLEDYQFVIAGELLLELKQAIEGGGSSVVPNPEGEATETLNKLGIDDTVYGIPKELPAVTSADNDSVLKVVEGSWSKGSVSTNTKIVTGTASISSNRMSASVSDLQISQWYDAGYDVIIKPYFIYNNYGYNTVLPFLCKKTAQGSDLIFGTFMKLGTEFSFIEITVKYNQKSPSTSLVFGISSVSYLLYSNDFNGKVLTANNGIWTPMDPST